MLFSTFLGWSLTISAVHIYLIWYVNAVVGDLTWLYANLLRALNSVHSIIKVL